MEVSQVVQNTSGLNGIIHKTNQLDDTDCQATLAFFADAVCWISRSTDSAVSDWEPFAGAADFSFNKAFDLLRSAAGEERSRITADANYGGLTTLYCVDEVRHFKQRLQDVPESSELKHPVDEFLKALQPVRES